MVPEWQKPGTPRAEERSMGRPPWPAAGRRRQRLVYSQQPAGQQVYHMDFDASQRLVRVEQVLTIAASTPCAMAWTPGTRTPALRPARADREGLQLQRRHLDLPFSGQYLPAAHVHIDPQGVVRRVMFTDEVYNDADRR
jgi:hypothetical protein